MVGSRVRSVFLCAAPLLGGAVVGCAVRDGMEDFGEDVQSPTSHTVDAPGVQLSAGSYGELRADPSGTWVTAETSGGALEVWILAAGTHCTLEDVADYALVGSERGALLAVLRDVDATGAGALSLYAPDCSEVHELLAGATLPTEFQGSQGESYWVRTGSRLATLTVTPPSAQVVGTDVSKIVDLGAGRLALQDGDTVRVVEADGTEDARTPEPGLLLGAAPTYGSAVLMGNALYALDGGAGLNHLADGVCGASQLAPQQVVQLCDGGTRWLSRDSTDAAPRLHPAPAEAAALLTQAQSVYLLEEEATAPASYALRRVWPTEGQEPLLHHLVGTEGTYAFRVSAAGPLLETLVRRGDSLDQVRLFLDSGVSVPVARDVYPTPAAQSTPPFLVGWDGAVADWVALDGLQEISAEVLAHAVAPVGGFALSGTSRFAYLDEVAQGSGRLELTAGALSGPLAPNPQDTWLLSRSVRPGQFAWTAGAELLVFIDRDATSATLRTAQAELRALQDVAEDVTHFVTSKRPSALVYAVGSGARRGLWMAGLQ